MLTADDFFWPLADFRDGRLRVGQRRSRIARRGDRAIVAVLLYHGLRREEAAQLMVADLHRIAAGSKI